MIRRLLPLVLVLLLLAAPASAAVIRTWNQSNPSPALSGCMDENYAAITCPDFNTTPPFSLMGRVVINGQTMVYVPKFWYKNENVTIGGFHYMNFSVSAVPLPGYSVHPWFIINGTIVPAQYMGAYEGSIYNVTSGTYVGDPASVNSQPGGDLLSSVAGQKPVSGLGKASLTLPGFRNTSHSRGLGWELQSFNGISAIQLLYVVEKGNWDFQSTIGTGVTQITDDGATNMAIPTGLTAGVGANSTDCGNYTCSVATVHYQTHQNTNQVSYRAVEGIIGDMWEFLDGINIKADRNPWIANYAFASDTFSTPYINTGLSLPAANGYGSDLSYSAGFDYGFLPSAVAGSSSTYLTDYYSQATGNRAVIFGGGWFDNMREGIFRLSTSNSASTTNQYYGTRLAYTPPVFANFTYTNTSATFTFDDESFTINTLTGLSGTPSSWNWSFGDGSVSSLQNPTHTYTAAGTYAVNLTVSDGTNYATAIQSVGSPDPVILAQFAPTGNITTWIPDGVTFVDASTGPITTWFWDFGDGTNSSLQNPPIHYYPTLGMYHVVLNVSVPNVYSINSTWVESSINGFSVSNTSGFVPLPVKFTNTTIGNVTTKSWGFGDGNASTSVSPTNIYWVAGEYTANYTVTHNGASNSTYRNITVENLDFVSTSGTSFEVAPVFVSFQDLSTVSDTWNWTFGDGGTSTDKNPIHLYIGEKGNFTVSLTATANGQSVTTTKAGYISIGFASNHEKIRNDFSGDLTGFFMAIGIACLFPIIIGIVLIARYLNNPRQQDAPTFLMDNGILLFVLILVLVIVLVFVGVIGGKIETIGL